MKLLPESRINFTAGLCGSATLPIPPQVTRNIPHVVFGRRICGEENRGLLKNLFSGALVSLCSLLCHLAMVENTHCANCHRQSQQHIGDEEMEMTSGAIGRGCSQCTLDRLPIMANWVLTEKFLQKWKFSLYVVALTQMESQVKFCLQNISGASQHNRVAAWGL